MGGKRDDECILTKLKVCCHCLREGGLHWCWCPWNFWSNDSERRGLSRRKRVRRGKG